MHNPNTIKPETGKKERSKHELLEYGKKQYYDYWIFGGLASEINKELDRVSLANKEVLAQDNFYKGRQRILKYLSGEKDEELEKIFSRQNFDLDKTLSTSDLLNQIRIIIQKDRSYDLAVKKLGKENLEFQGFTEDPDFSGFEETIKKIFPKELLDKTLISGFIYKPNIAHIWLGSNEGTFNLPIEKYEEWKRKMPEIANHKYRAENYSTWNADHNFSLNYLAYPIYIYSFLDDNPSKYDYLDDFQEDQKMKIYKIGTICHEVGHHIYHILFNSEQRKIWKTIIDKFGKSLTFYSSRYSNEEQNKKFNYDEEFAEAIRLYTTNPTYLQNKSKEIYNFLQKNFPEIKSI